MLAISTLVCIVSPFIELRQKCATQKLGNLNGEVFEETIEDLLVALASPRNVRDWATPRGPVLLHVTPSWASPRVLADVGLLPLLSFIGLRSAAGHVAFEMRLAFYLNCPCFSGAVTLHLHIPESDEILCYGRHCSLSG